MKNRDIKFRAWQPHSSLHRKPGMYSVDDIVWYQPDAEGHTGEAFLTRELGTSRSSEYLEDIRLMQYTGLKDKNGVEIYEGDILTSRRCPQSHLSCSCVKVPDPRFTDVVIFSDGAFVAPELEWPLVNYEVIGNIYENPEFLKAGDA